MGYIVNLLSCNLVFFSKLLTIPSMGIRYLTQKKILRCVFILRTVNFIFMDEPGIFFLFLAKIFYVFI